MVLLSDDDTEEAIITAWQCIGCGKIEYPRPCIGVCQDQKVDLVYGSKYREALAREAAARDQLRKIASVLRQIANTTPKQENCDKTWHAFQQKVRKTLLEITSD